MVHRMRITSIPYRIPCLQLAVFPLAHVIWHMTHSHGRTGQGYVLMSGLSLTVYSLTEVSVKLSHSTRLTTQQGFASAWTTRGPYHRIQLQLCLDGCALQTNINRTTTDSGSIIPLKPSSTSSAMADNPRGADHPDSIASQDTGPNKPEKKKSRRPASKTVLDISAASPERSLFLLF